MAPLPYGAASLATSRLPSASTKLIVVFRDVGKAPDKDVLARGGRQKWKMPSVEISFASEGGDQAQVKTKALRLDYILSAGNG